MIDVGLLASIAIMLIVPAVFVQPWPASAVVPGVIDVAGGALLLGVVAGRLTAVAIDDPGSLTSLGDLLVIRSGVEFWAGAVAALTWIAIRSRNDNVAPIERLAAITTPALVAWASYEATCILRDGCPGPVSSIGLRPEGLVQKMLPIGLMVAVVAAGVAAGLRWLHRRGMSHAQVLTLALVGVATIRSVASLWLPHIGSGLTRQHTTSMVVAVVGAITFVALRVRVHRSSRLVTS